MDGFGDGDRHLETSGVISMLVPLRVPEAQFRRTLNPKLPKPDTPWADGKEVINPP